MVHFIFCLIIMQLCGNVRFLVIFDDTICLDGEKHVQLLSICKTGAT